MASIHISLNDELIKEVKLQAEAAGVPVSTWCAAVLREALERVDPLREIPTERRGTYARYDLDKIKRAIPQFENSNPRKAKVLTRALEKLQSPGRNVLTGPQREAVRPYRLADYT